MTWEEAVKTMAKWFETNIHTYWGGGKTCSGKPSHGKNYDSKDNPKFAGGNGSGCGATRATFNCDLPGMKTVQNDCTAFVGACCKFFKPDIFPDNFSDFRGSSDSKLQQAGFQKIPWSKDAMQPGDITFFPIGYQGRTFGHGEVYAGNGKAYTWGSVHDTENGGMPSKADTRTFRDIWRLPGGWTGSGSAGDIGGGGGGATGGATGGGSGSWNGGWVGDWDEEAAAADASRGKKLFSTTTAQANILSLLFTGKDSSTLLDSSIMKTPPRIWQYFPPEIVLPTMSFPVNPFEEDEPIWDASTQKLVAKKLKDKLERQEKGLKKKSKKTESDPKKIAENENVEVQEEQKKNSRKSAKNKGKKKNTKRTSAQSSKPVKTGNPANSKESYAVPQTDDPNVAVPSIPRDMAPGTWSPTAVASDGVTKTGPLVLSSAANDTPTMYIEDGRVKWKNNDFDINNMSDVASAWAGSADYEEGNEDKLINAWKEEFKRGSGKQAKDTHEKWWQKDLEKNKKHNGWETKPTYSVEADLKKDLGRSYPIIYINDHRFSEDEIEYFKLDCTGFLPTVELHVTSPSKAIIKQELPKEGDTMGVFIQYTHTMIAPLRCDFIITEAISKTVSQEFMDQNVSLILYGELKIPDLYNSNIAFEYKGSARNALIDIAQKLKLGFCFNDPEDSSDAQCWYCTPEQSGDPKQYMEDLATHIYRDSSSFFDAWIDPRYNLTVINVRDMLGRTADCDDGIDLTKMVSIINANYYDGDKQEKNKSIVTPKIFNNFLGEQQADTYYVYDYKLINQASEISNKMGLLQHSNFGINACGLPASLTIEINPQLCLNWEKVEGVTAKGKILDTRYMVMNGPGINRNQNDNPPENGSYVKSKTRTHAASSINVQSDDEMEAARTAESNNIKIKSQEEANREAASESYITEDGEIRNVFEGGGEVVVTGQAPAKPRQQVPGMEFKGDIVTLKNKGVTVPGKDTPSLGELVDLGVSDDEEDIEELYALETSQENAPIVNNGELTINTVNIINNDTDVLSLPEDELPLWAMRPADDSDIT